MQAHLTEVYGTGVSRETISKITERILDELADWANRPLDRVYPVLLLDAIRVKIRDGQVTNRPVYTAVGVTKGMCWAHGGLRLSRGEASRRAVMAGQGRSLVRPVRQELVPLLRG